MKTITFITVALMALILPALAFGASLQWDYPADWAEITGYTIRFTDGTNNYNKTIGKADVVEDGVSVTYADIESNLNLNYDITYDIYIEAYNSKSPGGPSNTVTYTRDSYVPPADSLPPPVGSAPSESSGLSVK